MRQLAGAGDWSGTAADLLDRLATLAGETVVRREDWPKAPRTLADQLRRLGPDFRAIGIVITFGREPRTGRRLIVVAVDTQSEAENAGKSASPASLRHPPGDDGDGGDDEIHTHSAHPNGGPVPRWDDPEFARDDDLPRAEWGVS